ncbi:hypothetical protein VNO77_17703 [Canavalia gladiata]|uniref:Uncharacterized protein n=1 Tax=Canavalia gladiata TaxID=3824 RepID=A0AAN9QMY5_CANGL
MEGGQSNNFLSSYSQMDSSKLIELSYEAVVADAVIGKQITARVALEELNCIILWEKEVGNSGAWDAIWNWIGHEFTLLTCTCSLKSTVTAISVSFQGLLLVEDRRCAKSPLLRNTSPPNYQYTLMRVSFKGASHG